MLGSLISVSSHPGSLPVYGVAHHTGEPRREIISVLLAILSSDEDCSCILGGAVPWVQPLM